jgi:hypothetical protein
VKTFRLQLPVIDALHIADLLDLVTDVDGVVAAMVGPDATLQVVVRADTSVLMVREQLLGVASAAASA